MKGIYVSSFAAVLCLFGMASCGEKKKTNDIITTKVVAPAPKAPAKMQVYERAESVEWDGEKYTVTVKRSVDNDAPVFSDDNGNKCHENMVSLVVARGDGSEFFRREFRKSSFSQYVDGSYLAKSTILGVAFDRVEGGKLLFVASVGCPDQLSDDFVPIILSLSKSGELQMKKGQDLDTPARPNADEEEGV